MICGDILCFVVVSFFIELVLVCIVVGDKNACQFEFLVIILEELVRGEVSICWDLVLVF